uniref:Uncharacterized protein n=1 Tax=Arundo donax TaxID=35708 RepID=A0A0A9CIE4_ARUDO
MEQKLHTGSLNLVLPYFIFHVHRYSWCIYKAHTSVVFNIG